MKNIMKMVQIFSFSADLRHLVDNASVSLAKGEDSSQAEGFHEEEINAKLLENR